MPNLDEDRAKIRGLVEDYMENGSMNSPLVLDMYPGVGKTTTVLEELFSNENKFIYLAPNHEVISDNFVFPDIEGDYTGRYEWFKSREKCCTNPRIAEYRQELEGMPIPIAPFCNPLACTKLDVDCPCHGPMWEGEGKKASIENECTCQCEYWKTRSAIEKPWGCTWAGVHAHITTYLKKYLEERWVAFSALVMEENPMSTLMEITEYKRYEINSFDAALTLFLEGSGEEGWWTPKPEFIEHVSILRDVAEAFAAWISFKRIRLDTLLNIASEWQDMAKQPWYNKNDDDMDVSLGWKEFTRAWETFSAQYLLHKMKVVINPVYLLDNIMQEINQVNAQFHVQITKNDWGNTGNAQPRIRLGYYHQDVLPNLNIKIIGLDGTARKDVWDKMLGRNCRIETIGWKYKNVYQLFSGEYPAQSFFGTQGTSLQPTGRSLIRIAAKITARRPEVNSLIVGTYRVKKHVDEIFNELGVTNYSYGTYYNLRSINKFKNCDTVVLLIRPRPPQDAMDMYVGLSKWPIEIWEDFFVKDEMLQTVGRPRQSSQTRREDPMMPVRIERGDVEIWVLPGVPIFEGKDLENPITAFPSRRTMEKFLDTGEMKLGTIRNEEEITEQILETVPIIPETITLKEISDIIHHEKVVTRIIKKLVLNGRLKKVHGKTTREFTIGKPQERDVA